MHRNIGSVLTSRSHSGAASSHTDKSPSSLNMRTIGPIVVVLLLVLTSCADSAGDDTTPTSQDGAVTTAATAAPPTTSMPPSVASTTAPSLADGLSIDSEPDVPYFTDERGTLSMDIYYPIEGGPWPLVVIYHGMTTSPATSDAARIAGLGAVVVAPVWLDEIAPTLTREAYIDGALFDRAACATSAAQQIAADYNADPAVTYVAGFSAGVHPAGWVGLGIVRNDLCDVALAKPIRGIILGDSQLIFADQGWDAAFADETSQAFDTNDRFVNPDRWDLPYPFAAFLWTSDSNLVRRTIEYPVTEDSWIIDRDPTGSIVVNLERVRAFDDGAITWMDNGLMLELLLNDAGAEAIHEAVGGGHYYNDKVFEGIAELLESSE